MNRALRFLASMAVILLLSLTSCQSPNTEEVAIAKPLAPMEEPALWTAGSVFVNQDMHTKKLYKTTFIRQEGLEVTRMREDGCLITRNYAHPFAQDERWESCPYPDGANDNVRLDNNQIWPLKVGNNWSYRKRGGNIKGRKWEDVRSCNVESQVQVTTQLGTFDTFKVVCENSSNVRTWYVSPAFKQAVKYVNYHKSSNSTKTYETVSYTLK